jgi:Ca-activated chloride channel family protein
MKALSICAPLLFCVVFTAQTRINVDVQLRQTTVTVLDEKGSLVKNLRKEDFTLQVNGTAQPIAHFAEDTDTPVTLGILIDRSGSMADPVAENLSGLRAASGITNVLLRLMQPMDEFLLMSFANKWKVEQNFTTDRRLIASAASKLEAADGTKLFPAVEDSFPQLKKGKHRKKALIIVTDALTDGDISELQRTLRGSEILVYTFAIQATEPGAVLAGPIKFGPYNSQEVMETLARESGGRSELFDMRSERVIDQMVNFVEEIAAELRGQYTLGYYPPQSSGYASIRIRTSNPNHQVRFREGSDGP